jgi:hypothetical protein
MVRGEFTLPGLELLGVLIGIGSIKLFSQMTLKSCFIIWPPVWLQLSAAIPIAQIQSKRCVHVCANTTFRYAAKYLHCGL